MTSTLITRTITRRIAPRILRTRPAAIIAQSQLPPTLQRRNMVMVTKTSASDTPPIQQQQAPIESPSNNSSLSIDSDELHITKSCMKRIQSLAEKRNESLNQVYLRVYVDAGGCSGFQYKFEMTKDEDEAIDVDDDVVFEDESGARVVVDSASMELIEGSTIDFVQEMIKSAFAVVDNPKSESACGCGSSFAIKNFEANPALD